MKCLPVIAAAFIFVFAPSFIHFLGGVAICIIAYERAVHFDNQIMKFLSWYGTYIAHENKRREKGT